MRLETDNIYFSGPDGVGKTFLTRATRLFLERNGVSTRIVHYPLEGTMSQGLLSLAGSGRIELASPAQDMAHVASRLESLKLLSFEREANPGLVYIFDRGPADGAVYAVAKDKLSEKPLGLTLEDVESWDRKFLEAFPPRLGFLLMNSPKAAEAVMADRSAAKEEDAFDKDKKLQEQVRIHFPLYVRGRKEWMTFYTDPQPGEDNNAREARVLREFLTLLADKIGYPQWFTDLTPKDIEETQAASSEKTVDGERYSILR